jgi:hypothetical protein
MEDDSIAYFFKRVGYQTSNFGMQPTAFGRG